LRRRLVDHARPFRVPGYPYVPAIFILTSAVMTVLGVMDDPKTNGAWLAILVAGIPVYYAWRKFFPAPIVAR
jgi:APA family basic amino acid/polyamine antiporter